MTFNNLVQNSISEYSFNVTARSFTVQLDATTVEVTNFADLLPMVELFIR